MDDSPERMKSAMSFAIPSDASPLEASGSNELRHRLNRDGIIRASLESHNNVISRKSSDERTSGCKAKLASKGGDKREAIQCGGDAKVVVRVALRPCPRSGICQ